MKLKIVSIFTSFLVLLNLFVVSAAQAQIAQVTTDKPDFTTLTAEEKTDFFTKIKNLFKPTPEEIGDKIKMKDKFKPTSEEISEKIKTGMQMKEKFKPSSDDIVEKIKAKAAAADAVAE